MGSSSFGSYFCPRIINFQNIVQSVPSVKSLMFLIYWVASCSFLFFLANISRLRFKHWKFSAYFLTYEPLKTFNNVADFDTCTLIYGKKYNWTIFVPKNQFLRAITLLPQKNLSLGQTIRKKFFFNKISWYKNSDEILIYWNLRCKFEGWSTQISIFKGYNFQGS
jgi:hypothetical protein